MTIKQRRWLYGLAAGFIGGASTSIDSGLVIMIAEPKAFNLDANVIKTLGTMASIGALAGLKVAVAYLKQSPLPPMDGDTQEFTKEQFKQDQNNIGNTMKVILGFTIALAAIFAFKPKAHSQGAYPPKDSILKQLDSQLKTEAKPAPPATDTTRNPQPATRNDTAGKVDEKAPGPWDAGQWTVSPFASYRAHEIGEFNGRFGGGLAVSYAPADNIAIELETLGETWRTDPWIDTLEEAGANFKGYLPFGGSGLAGYGFIGYTRNLQVDQNRMNAGAGLEVRAKRVYAFADGRWTHDFVDYGHALFRLGGGLRF